MTIERTVAKALSLRSLGLKGPPRIAQIQHEVYEDSSNEDSLRVWVVLDDRTTDAERTWRVLEPIERTIREALLRAGVTQFPYIYFLTKTELAESRTAGNQPNAPAPS